MLTITEVKQRAKGHFFSVEFVKKDGTLRKMCCRLGVKKYLHNGKLKYNPEEQGYLVVWDRSKKDYRNVNIHTIKKLKIGGQTWVY